MLVVIFTQVEPKGSGDVPTKPGRGGPGEMMAPWLVSKPVNGVSVGKIGSTPLLVVVKRSGGGGGP